MGGFFYRLGLSFKINGGRVVREVEVMFLANVMVKVVAEVEDVQELEQLARDKMMLIEDGVYELPEWLEVELIGVEGVQVDERVVAWYEL